MRTTLRDSLGAAHAAILGVGAYRPRRVVSNAEICERIDSSDEWIQTRSGIRNRRFAGPDETVQAMSVAAGGKALAQAGVRSDEVGCVIVATVSHLLQTPSVAAAVAEELGTRPAAAFDVSAACAGFCYGVALANDMVRGGTERYVLVVGVERLSDLLDLDDRSTAFIFADGAGAVLVGPTEHVGIGPVAWGADGSQYDLIRQKETWSDAFAADKPAWPNLTMEGSPVFRWAAFEMAKVAQEALDRAGIGVDELDVFVPHQANMRITDAMAKALQLPSRVRIARDIAEQGNTSAASIPLALDSMLSTGDAKSGDTALLVGFGAGLTYAAQVVVLP